MKLALNLIPPEWIRIITNVLEVGAKKYTPNEWMNSLNTENHEVFKSEKREAAKRHILEYEEGNVHDLESGKHNLAMAAVDLLFVYWYDLKKKKEPLPITAETYDRNACEECQYCGAVISQGFYHFCDGMIKVTNENLYNKCQYCGMLVDKQYLGHLCSGRKHNKDSYNKSLADAIVKELKNIDKKIEDRINKFINKNNKDIPEELKVRPEEFSNLIQ